MQTHSQSLWWLRLATFSLAALAAGSAAYWTLKWLGTAPPGLGSAPVVATPAPLDPLAVARLLGGGQAGATVAVLPTAASRFKLTGVVADRAHGGYALLSMDGKPAKSYRVGARVDETLLLQSVGPRSAALAASLDAPASVTLELPQAGAAVK